MDLLSSVSISDWKTSSASSPRPLAQQKWCFESDTRCCISTRNVIAFTSCFPLDDDGGGGGVVGSSADLADRHHHVFAADLNTPWDVHRITTRQSPVTGLAWDCTAGQVAVSDAAGLVEVWRMRDATVSEWKCAARTTFAAETFVKIIFLHRGRTAHLNPLDRSDLTNYKEKFPTSHGPDSLFMERNVSACLLVGGTGIVAVLAHPLDDGDGDEEPATLDNGKLVGCTATLGTDRARVRHADATYATKSDGEVLVAVINGDPDCRVVKMHAVKPSLDDDQTLSLRLDAFPGLFVQAAVRDLCFVTGGDGDGDGRRDSLAIASADGLVQLWELKEQLLTTHKMLLLHHSSDPEEPPKTMTIPRWIHSETFRGSSQSEVTRLTACNAPFRTARTAACCITVACADGSVRCLVRESLRQIASVHVPKVRDVAFSEATGGVVVAVDAFGQLHVYRASPACDPAHVVTALEYCLVTGCDWWDVAVCAKAAHLESVCERLTEQFHRQPVGQQLFYFNRLLAMKTSLLRLGMTEENTFKAADCFAQLVLTYVNGVFKSILRPSDASVNDSLPERVSQILQTKMKEQVVVDKLVAALLNQRGAEFAVDPSILHSHQNLIQWTTNLACHLMASVPEYKNRTGPGMTLVSNRRVLNMLREMLLLIRLWSKNCPGVKPTYTRTVESYDVIERLFHLITKHKENHLDESIHEECVLLPSHVIIPPVNAVIPARGLAVSAASNAVPASYEYGVEPDPEFLSRHVDRNHGDCSFVDGSTASAIDCVQQTFVGKSSVVRRCTRCHGTTAQRCADARWVKHCLCGGSWKVCSVSD